MHICVVSLSECIQLGLERIIWVLLPFFMSIGNKLWQSTKYKDYIFRKW